MTENDLAQSGEDEDGEEGIRLTERGLSVAASLKDSGDSISLAEHVETVRPIVDREIHEASIQIVDEVSTQLEVVPVV